MFDAVASGSGMVSADRLRSIIKARRPNLSTPYIIIGEQRIMGAAGVSMENRPVALMIRTSLFS